MEAATAASWIGLDGMTPEDLAALRSAVQSLDHRGLAARLTEAARFIAERGVIEEGAPVLVRFITQVASRFGVVVTQKVAAQTLPVVGALGGGAVNYAFIEHFQEVALGHFTVRRLERVTAKMLYRRNMSALLGTTEANYSRSVPGLTEKPSDTSSSRRR